MSLWRPRTTQSRCLPLSLHIMRLYNTFYIHWTHDNIATTPPCNLYDGYRLSSVSWKPLAVESERKCDWSSNNSHNVSSDSIFKSKGYCWAPFFCTTTQNDGGKHRWIHTSCWTGTSSSLQSISSEKRVHKYFFVCHPSSLISTQLKKINSHERKSGESVSRRKIMIKWTSG